MNAQKNAEQAAAREAGVGTVQLAPPSAAAPADQTRLLSFQLGAHRVCGAVITGH